MSLQQEKESSRYHLEVRVDLTTDEYLKYTNSSINRRPMMIIIYALTAVVFLSILWEWKMFGSISWQNMVFLGFMLLMPTYLLPSVFNYKARKVLEQDVILSGRPFYRFNEKGIVVSAGSNGRRYSWNDLYGIKETKEVFALQLDQTRALLLPKRCFSEQVAQDLRELLDSRTEVKRKHLMTAPDTGSLPKKDELE